MNHLFYSFLTRLFALIRGLARFLRGWRSFHTPAETSPAPPVAAPSALSEIEAHLDDQIAEFDQWEREYNREQRAYRKLLRDQARARGELTPAKPRKPREPQSKSRPKTPLQALPDTSPAVSAAPPVIPTRPIPSQATPPRTLFKILSRIVTAPLRLLKTVLIALPRLFFRRRPPSDGPPTARPAAPSLQNRAA